MSLTFRHQKWQGPKGQQSSHNFQIHISRPTVIRCLPSNDPRTTTEATGWANLCWRSCSRVLLFGTASLVHRLLLRVSPFSCVNPKIEPEKCWFVFGGGQPSQWNIIQIMKFYKIHKWNFDGIFYFCFLICNSPISCIFMIGLLYISSYFSSFFTNFWLIIFKDITLNSNFFVLCKIICAANIF